MGDRQLRPLMETFKLLETGCIAITVASVCRRWRNVANCCELWRFLLYRDSGHELGFYASPSQDEKLTYFLALCNSRRRVALLTRFPCTEFTVFNTETGRKETVCEAFLQESPSWCYLAMGGLLVCGGKLSAESCRKSVMLAGTLLMSVSTSDMREGRDGHSLCRARNSVFAFGGKSASGDLATCERFDIGTQCWNYTASLPAPLSEVATAFISDLGIILFHVKLPTKMMKFSPTTEAYYPLSIRFLSAFEPLSMFSAGHSLLILGKDFSVNCDMRSLMQQHRFCSPSLSLTPRAGWLLAEKRAFAPLQDGSLLKIELERCTAEIVTMRR